MGSIIGEMVGDWLVTEKLKQSIESGEIKLGSDEYNKLLNTVKITAGAIALLYDFDVDTAVRRWRIMLFTLIRVKRSKRIRIKQMS